ncbi:MAG: metal-dependent hydrolase [Flavobacteriaceae bacterium]|jgi:L-ascorbate metabolism protein UlaG (beta-lactamase superfamily)|nr:metal-dependent hydrolase [Flavobacteriaceae bacterium]
MEIIYYGHACFGYKTPKAQFIIDPFITANELAKDIDINKIEVDYILLTHAHFDHILDVEIIAKNNPNAVIVANFEIATHYANLGYNVVKMNIGGVKKFHFGKIKMVNAVHSSSFPDGKYGGQAAGFLLKIDGKVIYHAGDTALSQDMRNLPYIYGYINVAVLPVGNLSTMGVYDAIGAAKFIGTRNVIASHYDTFPGIRVNKEKAVAAFLSEEKKLTFISIGSTVNVDQFI